MVFSHYYAEYEMNKAEVKEIFILLWQTTEDGIN